MNFRKTTANITLHNIKYNVEKLIETYNDYKYYIGVVKADSYGHNSDKVVRMIIEGGCNYLAVSSLDEALEIREKFNIPILCLGIIHEEYMSICEEYSIDVTVTNKKYLEKIKNYNLNVHVKIDTGMNRLGVKDKDELNEMIDIIKDSNLYLKGIFTHIYDAGSKDNTNRQIDKFNEITSDIDLSKIDMVHIAQSDTLTTYPKIKGTNGVRLGIAMYGFTSNDLNLKSTFSLCSEVIEIKHLKKGETVSYGGLYTAKENETIGIVCIGYADGVNRKLSGSYVYINDKKYETVGNICMDMLMVKIDDSVKIYDKVYIYKDIDHIKELSKYLDTIPYELICNVSKRVPRKYVK